MHLSNPSVYYISKSILSETADS